MLKIKMSGSVKNCVDDSNRMNIDKIRVCKGTNPWIVATDSRLAVAIRSEGESDAVAIIPASVFPSVAEIGDSRATRCHKTFISMNGDNTARLSIADKQKRTIAVNPENSQFPTVTQVIPEFTTDDCIVVSVNLSALGTIHEALAKSGNQYCTLFIRKPKNEEYCDTAIGILGANGIGVLMPTTIIRDKELNNYNAAVKEFKAAY